MFSTTPARPMVADALSRITMGSVSHIEEENKELVKDVLWFIINPIHH